jgi:hypothetical protein
VPQAKKIHVKALATEFVSLLSTNINVGLWSVAPHPFLQAFK